MLYNKKGEVLCTIIINSSREVSIKPIIKSWPEAIAWVKSCCEDRNTDTYYVKCVHSEINEERHRANFKAIMNHKGWGYDYFEDIYIEPLCLNLWEIKH